MAPGLATQLHASPMSPRQALPPASSMETLITSPSTGGTLTSWASAPTSWPNPAATRQVGPWGCLPSSSPRPGRGARGRESWAWERMGRRGRARADGGARWERTDCRVGGERPTGTQDQTTGRMQVKTPLGASCFLGLLGLRAGPAADTPAGRGRPASPGHGSPRLFRRTPPLPLGSCLPSGFLPTESGGGAPPPPWGLRNVSGMSEPAGVLP